MTFVSLDVLLYRPIELEKMGMETKPNNSDDDQMGQFLLICGMARIS